MIYACTVNYFRKSAPKYSLISCFCYTILGSNIQFQYTLVEVLALLLGTPPCSSVIYQEMEHSVVHFVVDLGFQQDPHSFWPCDSSGSPKPFFSLYDLLYLWSNEGNGFDFCCRCLCEVMKLQTPYLEVRQIVS